jgi:PAS domain S-box-containing protein
MQFTDQHVLMLTGKGDLDAAKQLTAEERKRCLVISDATKPDMPIIFMSDQFEEQTGYSEDDVIGCNCRFLQGAKTDPDSVEAIRKAIAETKPITVDILNYRKDGSEFWNRLRIRPLIPSRGDVKYFVGFQNPINAEQVRSEPIYDFVD